MRLSSLYSLTALASCALAEDAYLWTVDHGAAKYANTQASSISPETASSIIARRRGLLGDDSLVDVDDSVLRDIKQYGGYQMPMMAATSDFLPSKLLIRIEGYVDGTSQFVSLPDLWIEDATKDLATDFKARKDAHGLCEYDLKIPTKDGVELVYTYDPEGSACLSMQELRIQPVILALYSAVPTAKNLVKDLNKLLRTLSHLAVTSNLETTLLVLPPRSKLQKPKAVRRAGPTEEPLELPTDETADATSTISGSRTHSTSHATKTSHALPRNIPLCFGSQDSCDSTTNSCSGHGSCVKAYAGCYKCVCNATIARKNKDGSVKSIYWGGNACQKKDISTEFVLFATIGVLFAALIAGAIGALYTMGSQDLPSVLGAGVGGTSKK